MRKILFSLLLLLYSSVLMSQNYIYPVTSGTSWARGVYPPLEQAKFKEMSMSAPLPGAPNFGQIFKQISDSYTKSNTYNDSIFFDLTHSEWTNMFGRRASTYAKFYEDNNKAIDQLKDYFSRDDVPEAAYDSLYFYTRVMYHHYIYDVFLFEDLINILLPHYEETHDVEHLIFCYICAGMYHFQCARMGDREAALRSEIAYHKVMNMRNHFADFKDPLNHYYFISAYVNLAVMHTQAGDASLPESLVLTQNIRKIYATPEVQQIFAKDSLLHEFANWSIDLFSLRGIATYISQGWKGERLKKQLYEAYIDFKNKIGNEFNSLNKFYYAKLPYEDLLIEAFMGHITWDEAQISIREMLAEDNDLKLGSNGHPEVQIGYLNNLFETSCYILDRSTLSFEEKQQSTKNMLNRMLDLVSHYDHSRNPFEKGMILENFARKKQILMYLNTEERRDLLFRLIVTQQPTTYVHVTMVADLAKVLTNKLIESKPQYFVGIPGINTVEDVLQNKDTLVGFIYDAAIFHDLGKINMPTVVNNCIRQITDHEHQILSLHPQKSLPFFDIDESLNNYKEIALGHHKWYNGNGYPASFNNLESYCFPIINIVTVCDCLDAATENVGRNYHHPKPFDVVLKEFISDSGTRYDPSIINLIRTDKSLQEALKQIVSDGRNDHYYKMYNGYMSKNNQTN